MPIERPNFYLLLDLDPSCDDGSAIEKRIAEKLSDWARDRSMGNPKARRRAEINLALLPEIRALLADAGLRRQEAKEAQKQQQREKQEKARELDEMIAVLASGGGACSESQLGKLVEQAAGAFSSEEVTRRLRAAGVSVGGEKGPEKARQRPVREVIDKVTAQSIRQNLEPLGLANLYQFLELPAQSSNPALLDRAEEIYGENQRVGRTDASASARNALAGICKTLFRSEPERTKYDNYLTIEAMDQLKLQLELAGNDGFITREEMDALVRQARQRGVSAEDARAYIEERAAQRKWGVQRDPAALPSESMKLCGFCSTLAPAAAANCPSCGEPLEIPCPRCGIRNPSANAACQGCGSRVGDAPLVNALLKEGERLVLEGDFVGALQRFDKALHYWPDWQPAADAKKRAEERRRAREGAFAEVEAMVASRKLSAARSALDRFERAHGTAGLAELRRRIMGGLARAEEAWKEGEKRRRAGDTEGGLDRDEEALAACADFEPALRTLAACPPPSPGALRVAPMADGFRLSWQGPATSRSVTYQVVRKAGGLPHGADDGQRFVEMKNAGLDDSSAAPGTPWFYAVYTQRGGVVCDRPATSGPHLRTAEVEDLQTVAGDREVTLSWTAPEGCRRVEVWRRAGKAPDRPEGTALTVAGSSARDTGLTDGQVYGYRVVAVFADPQHPGGELRTAGRCAAATPVAPPAPILDLAATRTGRNVVLRWSSAAEVAVQIRQTTKPPDAIAGLVVPAAQADRFGSLVAGATGNSAQVTLTGQGRIFFIPLSISAATAVVGAAVEVTTLDPAVETFGQRASVAYRVGVKKSLLRRSVEDAWLELTCTGAAGLTLPALVVVGKAHDVPISPRDGQVLLEVPGLKLDRGRTVLPLPAQSLPGRLYVKLFFHDAAAAREIRLLPAEKELLKIA